MTNLPKLNGKITLATLSKLSQAFSELRSKATRQTTTIEPEIPDPVAWAEFVSGNTLDKWQQDFMYSTAARILLNCSRQVGKTEAVSLKAAYRARYLAKKVLVLAPSLYQSSKVRVRAERFLNKTEGTRFITKNATTLELDNGGSVIALPGDRPDLSARGETTDDLIVDEASRVRSELIVAAAPTQATKADATLTYLSTPAGKQGEFHRAWTEDLDWEKIEVPATECSRISQAFLDRFRRQLGPIMFSQEFECQFIANSAAILDPEAVAAMFGTSVDASMVPIDWATPQTKRITWPSSP